MAMRLTLKKVLFLLPALTLLIVAPGSVRAGVTDPIVEMGKAELVSKLNAAGFPVVASYFDGLDVDEIRKLAEQVKNGDARGVFEDALRKKQKEIQDELYKKAKGILIDKKVFGDDTETYLGWVEENGADALALSEKILSGDYRGAGDMVRAKMREKLEAKIKAYATDKAVEVIDFFLAEAVGQSVGGIYLKLIELELMAIDQFAEYSVGYFGTHRITLPDGSVVKRNWCEIYCELRKKHAYGPSFYDQLDESGLNNSIDYLITTGGNFYSTSKTEGGPDLANPFLSTPKKVTHPDAETFHRQLEACCTNLNMAKIKANAERRRQDADRELFVSIHDGIEEKKREIIIIIEGIRFASDISVVVTVADKDTGKNITGATVTLDTEKKDAPGGVATFSRPLEVLSGAGGTSAITVAAEAKDYEPKTESLPIAALSVVMVKGKPEVPIKILLAANKLPEDVAIDVTVTDKKTGEKIKDAKATFDGETLDAPDGVASFSRKGSAFAADQSGTAMPLAAEAAGYKPGSATYTAGELAAKFDKSANKIELTIALEPLDVDDVDSYAVSCAPPEILETEAAVCSAVVSLKSGTTADVSSAATWTPAYVNLTKGTVKGKEAKAAAGTLPTTVTAEATYVAPPEQGGKTWVASADVFVKPVLPVGPSGIRVTKAANKKKVGPGEKVTYTYALSNTGSGPVTQVDIGDDKCSPLTPKIGDADGNGALDANETWIYECSTSHTSTTTNTVTAEGRDGAGKVLRATAKVTVEVPPPAAGAGPCPPPQVLVPGVIGQAEGAAQVELKKKPLVGYVIKRDNNETVAAGIVINQDPPAGECVDPNSTVNLWVSLGPKPIPPPAPFVVKLDCGNSFELVAGDFAGRGCGVVVQGWRGNTEDRVTVRVEFPASSGIEVFPGDTSAPPSLMYTAGVTDFHSSYTFSESFRAKDTARQGTTRVMITVAQAGAGSVTLSLDILVLAKGSTASQGPGIRPPASVSAGSGGEFCAWRTKMFGSPPNCFNFNVAKCGSYGPPSYELVGSNMTWGEADTLISKLSSYMDDAYNCRGTGAAAADSGGGDKGGGGKEDADDPPPPEEPPPPPPEEPPFDDNYDDFVDTQNERDKNRPGQQDTGPHGPRDGGFTTKDLEQDLDQDITRIVTLSTECDASRPCRPGMECRNGKCVPGPCVQDQDCAADETCVQGKCRKKPGAPCVKDQDCPADETCVQGKCRKKPGAQCVTDQDCPAGQSCVKGKCEKRKSQDQAQQCRKDSDCPAGQKCVNGKCQKGSKSPPPTKIKCDAVAKSGGNTPEQFTVQLGDTVGLVTFTYDMFSVPDQMTVSYGGKQVVNTGCIGAQQPAGRGSGSASFMTNGTNTTAKVSVNPSCEGGSTQWTFTMGCPVTGRK